MPRSKSAHHYPDAFKDLIREGAVRSVDVPLPTPEEAVSLRGRLFAFFGALTAETKRADCPEEFRLLRQIAYKIQLRITKDRPNVLVVQPLDFDPATNIVKAALANAGASDLKYESNKLKPSSDLLKSLQDAAKADGLKKG